MAESPRPEKASAVAQPKGSTDQCRVREPLRIIPCLSACADVVLLGDDAKIATGFARLGLSGDGGSSWYLPRLIGLRRAMQLSLLGRIPFIGGLVVLAAMLIGMGALLTHVRSQIRATAR